MTFRLCTLQCIGETRETSVWRVSSRGSTAPDWTVSVVLGTDMPVPFSLELGASRCIHCGATLGTFTRS